MGVGLVGGGGGRERERDGFGRFGRRWGLIRWRDENGLGKGASAILG